MEKKVHLVPDGAAYHQSELVKNAAKVLNIELHYLPPYSPNFKSNRAVMESDELACKEQYLLLLEG